MGKPSLSGLAEDEDLASRPRSEITELRHRVSRGEDLDEDEQQKLRAYYARYSRRKQGVHLSGGREEEWRAQAAAQGVSLSTWMQDRVVQALQGPGEIVRELRDENQRLRDEVAALRGTSGHLAVENSKLQARLEAMEASLMEAMDHALRLAEA